MKKVKKVIPAMAAVLLVSSAAPVFTSNVALADEQSGAAGAHSTANVNASNSDVNVDQLYNQLAKKFAAIERVIQAKEKAHEKHKKHGEDKEHGKRGDGEHDKKEQAFNAAKRQLHQAQLKQLHDLIAQLHSDQKAARDAREALRNAAHNFIQVMKTAIQSDNADAIKQGNDGVRQILQTLKSAIQAQAEAVKQTKHSAEAGKHGDLTKALQAIQAWDSRLKAKTQAMKTAADALNQLTAKIQGMLTTNSSTNASGSTQNSGNASVSAGSSNTNTDVQDAGKVTITVGGSN